MRILVFVLFVVGYFDASALDSLRTEKKNGQYFVVHRVEKGETLYSLSKRYNSHLNEIVRTNQIENNSISLGQELMIPIEGAPDVAVSESTGTPVEEDKRRHIVMTGETLYAISRKYGVSVGELRKLNRLTSNEISIGQSLIVGTSATGNSPSEEVTRREATKKEEKKEKQKKAKEPEVPAGFKVYYVQSGELLGSIARKFNVRPDSIVIWNDLQNTYLSIGQKLLIKGEIDREYQKAAPDVTTRPYGTMRKTTDQSGFTKIFEEGIASKIESSVETDKYLALHRTLPMGTLIEVRNLMNNQKVFVRVVGKLPETGLNENVLIRLTPVCFERLGVIDPKARVEVSYYLD